MKIGRESRRSPRRGRLRFQQSLLRCGGGAPQEDVDLAGDIEIVSLIVQAGLNHRRTGGCERAGTVRYDRPIRPAIADRGSSTSKTRAGRPSSVANFSIGGTAAGEHWVQTSPLGLRGPQNGPYSRWRRKSSTRRGSPYQLAIAARASTGLLRQ